MKQLLTFFLFVVIVTSCSIERRHYLPGYHLEGRTWRVENAKGGLENGEWRMERPLRVCTIQHVELDQNKELQKPQRLKTSKVEVVSDNAEDTSFKEDIAPTTLTDNKAIHQNRYSPLSILPSPLATTPSPLAPDTLKKPFKPQQQYREVDPVGKASVIVVLAGVALQKIAGLLAWYEVALPLTFGPSIFIPALIVVLIGVGLSAYSAYRVRKYPEKYKKNEWSKAALAILGWQILMSALFAWLLGGLPVG
jgi:hypothetical protein